MKYWIEILKTRLTLLFINHKNYRSIQSVEHGFPLEYDYEQSRSVEGEFTYKQHLRRSLDYMLTNRKKAVESADWAEYVHIGVLGRRVSKDKKHITYTCVSKIRFKND